jgi:molybdopterin synthase catalytic subunit
MEPEPIERIGRLPGRALGLVPLVRVRFGVAVRRIDAGHSAGVYRRSLDLPLRPVRPVVVGWRSGALARDGDGRVHYDWSVIEPSADLDRIALVTEPLPILETIAWATTPASGAVVTFSGVVREQSEGRPGVTAITYEAYEEAARERLGAVAAETRRRHPTLQRLALLHRMGHLELSETSVLVVASAPHRGEAFEAARYAIDTLKETVPIWKREHWAHGSDWAAAAFPVRSVRAE